MPQYIDEKIEILKQFGIKLTPEEKLHLHNLKTEISVDNFARTRLVKHFGED